jgi:hypothetical protein
VWAWRGVFLHRRYAYAEVGEMDGNSGWRRLAAAVVLQAARDALSGDSALVAPARQWLADEGAELVQELDLDPDQMMGWVESLEPALQPLLL